MSEQSAYTMRLPGEVSIGVTSSGELELNERERLLLGAYLPGVTIQSGLASDADQLVRHVESSDKGLDQNDEEVEIRDLWQDRFPADLPHLLYGVARSQWLRRGLYPVHAACMAGQKTSLLPGHSGVGKTSTALALATEYGQKIFSGNTTLAFFGEQGIQPVAGTRTMTLRAKDFESVGYEAASSFRYGDRIAFLLSPEQYADRPVQAVGRVALIRLADHTEQWSPVESESALHQLYPYFMDTVHQDVIVAGGAGVYVGTAAPESRAYLVQSLKRALTCTDVAQGVGSVKYVSERLLAS